VTSLHQTLPFFLNKKEKTSQKIASNPHRTYFYTTFTWMHYARLRFPRDHIVRLQCLSAGAQSPIHAGAFVSLHLLWSTCIPGYLQKNNVAKGGPLTVGARRRKKEREREREISSKGGWEERRKMYKHADAGRFVSGTASRLFPPSLRNQAVHHVSPFFLPLLAVTSCTRVAHTGWLKIHRS